METLIKELLRVLCPHLRRMAANTSNPVDDIVVNIVCMMSGVNPDSKRKGGIEL
jgi:hypothetical protein